MVTQAKKQPKYHVRSGDTVMVIAGNAKGKSGIITEMLYKKSRVIIEGVNLMTKHVKPNAQNPQGGIEKVAGSIHLSNVMVVDPATGKPTKTGRKLNEKGKLQRFSKETGKFI